MKSFLLLVGLSSFVGCIEAIQSPSEIPLPVSKPSNFETYDSSFLKIEIENDKYKILYLKDTSLLADINSLDIFLQKQKTTLNKDKIIVRGFDNNDSQKAFKDVLGKYGISKFIVNNK